MEAGRASSLLRLAGLLLAGLVCAALLARRQPENAFVAAAAGARPALRATPDLANWLARGGISMRAAKDEAAAEGDEEGEEADAEESDDEMLEDDDDELMDDDEDELMEGRAYPAAAYVDYGPRETPPEEWFERRTIDKLKVNNIFFDMYKKPRSFFPHDLRPGDTIRAYFLEPSIQGTQKTKKNPGGYLRKYSGSDYSTLKETYFDGTVMKIDGDLQDLRMHMRCMIGQGSDAMGWEIKFPLHSPYVTRLDVLRRGYIGRAKDALFVRAMVGKQNTIPLDKERTKIDVMYENLREEGREDEIPEPGYPMAENNLYPLPLWRQDDDDWDEAQYDPSVVDRRTSFDKNFIAGNPLRPLSRAGGSRFTRKGWLKSQRHPGRHR